MFERVRRLERRVFCPTHGRPLGCPACLFMRFEALDPAALARLEYLAEVSQAVPSRPPTGPRCPRCQQPSLVCAACAAPDFDPLRLTAAERAEAAGLLQIASGD